MLGAQICLKQRRSPRCRPDAHVLHRRQHLPSRSPARWRAGIFCPISPTTSEIPLANWMFIVQRLLHVLYLPTLALQEHLARWRQRAQGADWRRPGGTRPATTRKSSAAAIGSRAHRTLRLRRLTWRALTNKDRKAAPVSSSYRNPIDAGRFHRHRIDAAGLQPVSQGMKVGGEALNSRTGSSSRSGSTAT